MKTIQKLQEQSRRERVSKFFTMRHLQEIAVTGIILKAKSIVGRHQLAFLLA